MRPTVRSLVGAIALLLIASPVFATRINLIGFETGTNEADGSGGVGADITLSNSDPRTGFWNAVIAVESGQDAYLEDTLTPADADTQGRAYISVITLPSDPRVLMGTYVSTHYGCRADLEPDGSVSLWYKDRGLSGYLAYGQTPLLTSGYHELEVHQKNGSGGSCGGPGCSVTCELFVDDKKVATGVNTSITVADYGAVTKFRVGAGAGDSAVGAYTIHVDDWVDDDNVTIGPGRIAPIYPDTPDGSQSWTANNCSSSTRYVCLYDYSQSLLNFQHDGGSGYVEDNTNNHTSTFTLTDALTCAGGTRNGLPASGGNNLCSLCTTGGGACNSSLISGASIKAVGVKSVGRETSSGTRTYTVNLSDGTNTTTTGTTIQPPSDLSYAISATQIFTTNPAGTAWTESGVNGLSAVLKKTSSGTNQVTALLVLVDIQEPTSSVQQNLQDRNVDGRLTVAMGWDSRLQGTATGVCSNDASLACSSNQDCTLPGVCSGSAKPPTILAGALTQLFAKSTTILNCGVNGNGMLDAIARLPAILTGVDAATTRYCINHMPATCTAASTCVGGFNAGQICAVTSECTGGGTCVLCTDTLCPSNDCDPQSNGFVKAGAGEPWCSLGCTLVVGSRLCKAGASAGADCLVDADCPSSTCSNYPGADLVVSWADVNDFHALNDTQCQFSNTQRPPCPALATVTPQATPTPGWYAVQRDSCTADSECGGAGSGLCTGNFQRACDANADCTQQRCVGGSNENATCANNSACPSSTCAAAGGTCNLSLQQPGTACVRLGSSGFYNCCMSTCTTNRQTICTTNFDCPRSDTCSSTAKACAATCDRIPCTTDAQCGAEGTVPHADGRTLMAGLHGTCTAGFCASCGPPAAKVCISGAYQYTACTVDADCGGGTCGQAPWTQWRTAVDPLRSDGSNVAGNTVALAALASGATPPRDLVFAASSPAYMNTETTHEGVSPFGWSDTNDGMLKVRDWLRMNEPNTVDLWEMAAVKDAMGTPRRCNNNPNKTCVVNGDCSGTGAACVRYKSTLRPSQSDTVFEEIHVNNRGGVAIGQWIADYLNQLRPVCSGDTTRGCGLCGGAGTPTPTPTNTAATPTAPAATRTPTPSVTPTANCTTSSDCAAGQKCKAADGICGGVGTCTALRAGKLCVHHLTTHCTTDDDCPATFVRTCTGGSNAGATCTGTSACPSGTCAYKDQCRPEGLLSAGEG